MFSKKFGAIDKVKFFKKPEDFRQWLDKNHSSLLEQWVGFYKKGSGKPSITWPESVDQALCYGWIDGLRKSIDEVSYKIRFTPRKKNSHWSDVNIKRIKELKKLKLVRAPGEAAFKRRTAKRSRKASYEQIEIKLSPTFQKEFQQNKVAWTFFNRLAPSTRKSCIWWVMSAKQEQTKIRRLNQLINSSNEGKLIPPLKWKDKSAKKSQ